MWLQALTGGAFNFSAPVYVLAPLAGLVIAIEEAGCPCGGLPDASASSAAHFVEAKKSTDLAHVALLVTVTGWA